MAPASLPAWDSAVFGAVDKSASGHGGASSPSGQAQELLAGFSVVGQAMPKELLSEALIVPADQVHSSAAESVASGSRALVRRTCAPDGDAARRAANAEVARIDGRCFAFILGCILMFAVFIRIQYPETSI